jgi:nucleoid-associated protein YgaU
VSVDRRFKFTFLAFLLIALAGFGGWYALLREDGGAQEIAQENVDGEIVAAPAQETAVAAGTETPADTAPAPVEAAVEPPASEPQQEAAVEAAPGEEAVAAASAEEATQVEEQQQIAAIDAQAEAPVEAAPEPAAPQASVSGARPVFDIVRVEPTGEAVIAGRSIAGATIELLRNGVVHDTVVADASGAFAFVPPPFPAGSSDVVLRSHGVGGADVRSEQSVTIVVSADGSIPMVAMVAPNQPTIVLSQPEETAVAAVEPPVNDAAAVGDEAGVEAETPTDAAPAGQQVAAVDPSVAPDARAAVRIAAVEAETGGGLYVTGEASPDTEVRLYLNDTFIAPAQADAEGRVTFSIQRGVRPGSYRVRLDEVETGTGSVYSRAEIVFDVPEMIAEAPQPAPAPIPDATVSAEPAEQVMQEQVVQEAAAPEVVPVEREATTTVPEISTALVERGDSLWRISRTIYGSGFRYTEIFAANREQIRNPDLIFPGQVFVLPPDAKAATPEAGASPN